MNIIMLTLNFLGAIFLFQWFFNLIKKKKSLLEGEKFFTWKRFRNSLYLILLIGLPLLLVNFILPDQGITPFKNIAENPDLTWTFSIILSALITLVWLIYIRSIDIYEPEKNGPIILTFILSAVSTVFIVGILYQWAHSNGFALNHSLPLIDNIVYSVFVIGGVEEFSKMIPVLLIMVFFPKAINEPYDFILYASVSALGFACMENISYIYESGLYNIGGRALYAIVAHMTFSSTIFYGWMLCRFNYVRFPIWIVVPFFFLIAITAHGFYDFWLFNFFENDYSEITTAFFLITIHIWFTMKNNSLNVSNFYNPSVKINNNRLRSYLIVSLTALLIIGYVLVALMDGSSRANQYLLFELFAYGYLVFYLAFGLSQYKIIQDRLHPLSIPFDFFVPKPRNQKE